MDCRALWKNKVKINNVWQSKNAGRKIIGDEENSLKGSLTVGGGGEKKVESVFKRKQKINENIDSLGLCVDLKEQKQRT